MFAHESHRFPFHCATVYSRASHLFFRSQGIKLTFKPKLSQRNHCFAHIDIVITEPCRNPANGLLWSLQLPSSDGSLSDQCPCFINIGKLSLRSRHIGTCPDTVVLFVPSVSLSRTSESGRRNGRGLASCVPLTSASNTAGIGNLTDIPLRSQARSGWFMVTVKAKRSEEFTSLTLPTLEKWNTALAFSEPGKWFTTYRFHLLRRCTWENPQTYSRPLDLKWNVFWTGFVPPVTCWDWCRLTGGERRGLVASFGWRR